MQGRRVSGVDMNSVGSDAEIDSPKWLRCSTSVRTENEWTRQRPNTKQMQVYPMRESDCYELFLLEKEDLEGLVAPSRKVWKNMRAIEFPNILFREVKVLIPRAR